MKLKRKLKGRNLVISFADPENPKAWYENIYEDVLVEPFHKLIFKKAVFWIKLTVIIGNIVSAWLTEDKLLFIVNEILAILFTIYLTAFIVLAWKDYKD